MSHAAHPKSISRTAAAAAVLAALAAAAGLWLQTAGSVSAPEPAKLTGTIAVSGWGPGVYLSGASTTILRWPSVASARPDGTPRAGQPCTTIWLPQGAITSQVIVAVGSSRLCY